jgi:hypothetical protein
VKSNLNQKQIDEWRSRGALDGALIMLIMRDLEDGELFPVYFSSQETANKYESKIISESKMEIVKRIKVQ